jgi:sulfur carrier protein
VVKINGKQYEAAGKTISEYLMEAGFNPLLVAVEFNEEIIPKAQFDTTVISDGDEIEIVNFVAGG